MITQILISRTECSADVVELKGCCQISGPTSMGLISRTYIVPVELEKQAIHLMIDALYAIHAKQNAAIEQIKALDFEDHVNGRAGQIYDKALKEARQL